MEIREGQMTQTQDKASRCEGADTVCQHRANVELERGTLRGVRYRILLCVTYDAEHVQSSSSLSQRRYRWEG